MRKLIAVLLVCVVINLPVWAQYVVKGVVTDSTGVGEPYATVRIYTQSNKKKPIKMGTTDDDGKFNQELTSGGKYTLQISSVGKITLNKDFELNSTHKVKDFGTLVIKNDANTLAGVEVTAQKPLVTTEIDRLSYDIQGDEESKTNNIFEMLKKVPLVSIDGEENIKVNGSSSFKIYKNGRPNTSWSNNPKDVLKSIPASMIKKVEVITEPGAKYDAEGVAGILNIVTDDGFKIEGVAGSVSLGTSNRKNLNAGTYLTTQIGKFTATVNYGINKQSTQESWGGENYTYVKTGNHFVQDGAGTYKGTSQYGNLEASYEIDTLNLITLSFGGYQYKNHSYSDYFSYMNNAGGDRLYSYRHTVNVPYYKSFDFNGKLDYQHLTKNKGEAFTFSYLISTTAYEKDTETDYMDYVNLPLDYTWYDLHNERDFYEHTFQFDWTRPFNKGHKVEMGVKYILRLNDSYTQQKYSNDEVESTDFSHDTHIGAAYAEYAYNSKRWGARAGLRYEYAHLKGDYKDESQPEFSSNIGDLVPTLSLSYKLNNANTLRLNYSTRVNRPGIAYLNPIRVETSPTNVSYGNPDLESTRNNAIRFSYSLMKRKISVNASIDHAWANNALTGYNYTEGDILYNTSVNAGQTRRWGLNAYVQWRMTNKTSIMINEMMSWSKSINKLQNVKNEGWNYFVYWNLSQKLPWKLNLSLNGNLYYSQVSSTYQKGTCNVYYTFALSRSFLKENRLSVRLSASAPFSSKYRTRTTEYVHGDIIGENWSRSMQRIFTINVSYRFGKLKASVKKTNKTITNDDLEGRK